MSGYLITGGDGFFGKAFTRYLLAREDVSRIAIFARDEFKEAQMAAELPADPRLRFFLGDVRDRARLEQVMAKIDVVIHAAALKRVDAVAYSSEEALKTNVLGTANVCQAAIAQGVPKVVFLSSDKAVHATNFYGASKFLAEQVAITSNVYGHPRGTKISVTRYGNVLGSRGSVLDIWRQQELVGLPITVTDIKMTRFWMTIQQAITLVNTAIEHMDGGEIFIPKLGAAPLVRVADVALKHTSAITFTGLRPGGEKLHETLLSDEELTRTHDAGNVYIVAPSLPFWRDYTPDYGPLVPPDFRYTSESARQLSDEELKAML